MDLKFPCEKGRKIKVGSARANHIECCADCQKILDEVERITGRKIKRTGITAVAKSTLDDISMLAEIPKCDPIDDIINAVLKSVEWAKVGEFYNPIIPASEREYVRTKIKVAIVDFIEERRKNGKHKN